jgi:ElaB/YqjD/DUF883 family membrane-anchored ribosome-binding protein
MELYYKDLISEDASVEKLVDELLLVVQGAEGVAEIAGAALEPEQKHELAGRLQRIKAACGQIKAHARSSAIAADKVLREYPYSSVGFAFAFGLMAGALLFRRR